MPDKPSDSARSGGSPGQGQGGGLGLGERLRSARKARAISLERIAEALNLDESVVLHLEEERFDEFGAPVFARGHLRAYARLVGLPTEVVLQAYDEVAPSAPSLPAVERRPRRSVTINPLVWGIAALVLLLGGVLTLYVLQDEDAASPPLVPEREVPQPGPAPVSAEQPAEPERANEVVDAVAPPPVGAVDEPGPEALPAPAPPAESVARPPAEGIRLGLNFREESWVEISDANGRLLFGLQRPGQREVSGEPPFRVLIGNAAGVDLSVNGEPYPVPASGVTGKVARFEIRAAAAE